MKTLSAQDASFLYLERSHQPMHVGGLHLYSLPEGAPKDYVSDLVRAWREGPFASPFNQKLVWPLRRLGQPSWVDDADIDAEYHLRHSALPAPGRYREMFALISRLHGTLLHRDRPLWEAHLIEGVESKQFAMYTKMHHAMIDGMGGMRLLQKSLSVDPEQRDMPAPWSIGRGPRTPRTDAAPSRGALLALAEQMQDTVGAVPGALRGLMKYADAMRRPEESGLVTPFSVPRTALNTRIGAARRFVAQSWKIGRIKAVGKALDATLNDIVLAMSAGALRLWLKNHAELPDEPLSCMAPVALTPKDAEDYGNAVTAILCSLATHIDDPVERLRAIQHSMNQGKALLQSMNRAEITMLTMLGSVPAALPLILGLGH
ncbi:MAG: wax ester/triacylglycerol synthase family O-acyltransferase, partial [Oceanococcaceae bacterium]